MYAPPVSTAPGSLLGPQDGPPFTVQNPDSDHPLVLLCDHSSNAVPSALDNLGLDSDALARHIAYDIGADAVTQRVADALGLCAVYCRYSRLVIDCNRYLADPSSFLPVSDGTVVPGNQNLSEADKQARVEAIRVPYHRAVAAALSGREADGAAAGLVAIHSFTPRMAGFERPWHVGVLWDQDPRFAEPLLRHFALDASLCVGDNEPYSGRMPADYTIDHHGERQGRPCVSLEIRQDLLLESHQHDEWAERVIDGLRDLVKRPELYKKRGNEHGERHRA
ncbi:MAG: N-formylglutamate amidohydrolase [Pseudomonadota bacterium]